MLPDLDAVQALIVQSHVLDDQFAVTAFAADLEALRGQDDVAAFVPADAASGVRHGAVQDHPGLLQDGLILQRFYNVDGDL